MVNETYVTRRVAAEMLGVSRQRVHTLINEGKLKTVIRLDRKVIRRLDVEKRIKMLGAANGDATLSQDEALVEQQEAGVKRKGRKCAS